MTAAVITSLCGMILAAGYFFMSIFYGIKVKEDAPYFGESYLKYLKFMGLALATLTVTALLLIVLAGNELPPDTREILKLSLYILPALAIIFFWAYRTTYKRMKQKEDEGR